MKKRIAIALLCLMLTCALTACGFADFEAGGLVGELLGKLDLPGVDVDPFYPIPPVEQPPEQEFPVTMGPGEELYGFPDSLDLKTDVLILELLQNEPSSDTYEPLIIDESVLARDQQFMDLYGYAVNHKYTPTTTDIFEIALSETTAGTGTLILCYTPVSCIADIAMTGAFHSAGTLAGFEMDNGCWFDALNEDLKINGKQYVFTGYLTPYAQFELDCLVYNNEKMREMGFDLTQTVYGNAWTMELFYELCTQVKTDLNGDGTWSDDDFWGAMYDEYGCADTLFYGSGVDLFAEESTGEQTYRTCVELAQWLAEYRNVTRESAVAEQLFMKGRSLFFATELDHFTGLDGSGAMITKSEFEVCVAPVPMYNKELGYHSTFDDGTVLSIPRSAQGDAGMALNVLSVLAANHTTPAIDTLISKVNPNEDSVSMCYTVMNAAYCNMNAVIVRSQGYGINPLQTDCEYYIMNDLPELKKLLSDYFGIVESGK